MQFFHDIRIVPIQTRPTENYGVVRYIEYGGRPINIYQIDGNCVIIVVLEFKTIHYRTYQIIQCDLTKVRTGVRIVPRGYAYLTKGPIRRNSRDALVRVNYWHGETHNCDRIVVELDSLQFIPRDETERIPFVYEDTGIPVNW
jgi:hypothetical protein